MKNPKALIIIGIVVLIFLIILTTILANLIKKEAERKNQKNSISELTLEQRRKLTKEQAEELARQAKNIKTLNPLNSNRFRAFREKVPFSSEDFDALYSPVLNTFFFSKKTPDAEIKIDEFLRENGVLDIKNSFPELFVIKEEPAATSLLKSEEEYLRKKSQENLITPTPRKTSSGGRTDQNNDSGNRPLLDNLELSEETKKGAKTLAKVIKDLVSPELADFDPLVAFRVSTPQNNNQGNAPVSTDGEGGINVQGRTVGKTTVPEGPNCTLTHVQIAAAAVLGRYGESVSTATIDWDWVKEAVAVAIPENGGLCSGQVADNYTSWGVWQAELKPYINYSLPNCKMGVPPTVNNNCAALFDPIINGKVMWLLYSYPPNQIESLREHGNKWGAYWRVAKSISGYRYRDFLDEGQQAASQLKSQL